MDDTEIICPECGDVVKSDEVCECDICGGEYCQNCITERGLYRMCFECIEDGN
jgi:hypothetical protein